MHNIDNRKVWKFLNDYPIMNIAASLDDKPLASIVLFDIDKNFNFTFATHESSYKTKALDRNKQASLSVWEHNNMLVQADGTVERLKGEDLERSFQRLAEASVLVEDFWPPILRIKSDFYVAFKITPTWMRALDLKSKAIKEKEDPFYEVKLGDND